MKKLILALIAVFAFSMVAFAEEGAAPAGDTAAPKAEKTTKKGKKKKNKKNMEAKKDMGAEHHEGGTESK